MARFFFLFVFLGQHRLQNITRFGDMRKVDLRNDALPGMARRRTPAMRRGTRFLHKMRANFLRLVLFQRAGVGLTRGNPEFRKNVENRARLHFQLFREIVDTNLAHPPLFNQTAANPPVSCS